MKINFSFFNVKASTKWIWLCLISVFTLTLGFQACQDTSVKTIESPHSGLFQISSARPTTEEVVITKGNGDSYSGFKANAFHYIEPQFTCPSSSGQNVPAIKERIEISNDQAILVINECNREVVNPIPMKDIITDGENTSVIYQGKTYIVYQTAPNLLDDKNYWVSNVCNLLVSENSQSNFLKSVTVKTNFWDHKIISVRMYKVLSKDQTEQTYAADFRAEEKVSNLDMILLSGTEVEVTLHKTYNLGGVKIMGDTKYLESGNWMELTNLDCNKPRMSLVKTIAGFISNTFDRILNSNKRSGSNLKSGL